MPEHAEELWDYLNDLEISGIDTESPTGHKLFGHPNEALHEHYGLPSRSGRSENIRD